MGISCPEAINNILKGASERPHLELGSLKITAEKSPARYIPVGFPGGANDKEPAGQYRRSKRLGFNS